MQTHPCRLMPDPVRKMAALALLWGFAAFPALAQQSRSTDVRTMSSADKLGMENRGVVLPQTIAGDQIPLVNREVLQIEEKTLALDPQAKGMGVNLYRFSLAAGEKIIFKIIQEEQSAVTQRLGLLEGKAFQASTPSRAQLERINRLSPDFRAKRIEFKNLETREFPLLLVVYGKIGWPFTVQIQREP